MKQVILDLKLKGYKKKKRKLEELRDLYNEIEDISSNMFLGLECDCPICSLENLMDNIVSCEFLNDKRKITIAKVIANEINDWTNED